MSEHEIAKYDANDCLLCRVDGKAIGQVAIRDLRDRYFGGYVIWNLLVYPGHRNTGVATELMNCVIKNYCDAPLFIGAEPFYDGEGPATEELRQWYESLGFKVWEDAEKNADGTWMVRTASQTTAKSADGS